MLTLLIFQRRASAVRLPMKSSWSPAVHRGVTARDANLRTTHYNYKAQEADGYASTITSARPRI
eukprot:9329662-Prorocentrum_lima.AAC.2